jgi:hypothetical protein
MPFLLNAEIIRLVFASDDNNCFSDGPDNNTECQVSISQNDDGSFGIAASVVDTISGGGDGWYSFLEGFVFSREAFHTIGASIPYGAKFVQSGYGWQFDSLEIATYWAKRWAIEGLGASLTFVCASK